MIDMTRALIFDSYFDDYRGVVLYVRVFEGEILKNSEILMVAAETKSMLRFLSLVPYLV